MNQPTAGPSKTTLPLKPLWEKGLLAAIFLLAVALRLWDLQKNGFCNTYYAATVRSMTMSWHNFFFDSFDPAGYVTVDKPPVAFWIQAVFAKLFGYQSVVLILPQVLEGLCSIGLVYYLVRRRFDAWAALLAAFALAICPISVAVDRYNDTDGCLATILLLAACFMARATEGGKLKLLLGSMVLVGIGFNTKMVVAFIVLPAFYLLYFLGAPGNWKKRLRDLTLASMVVAVAALAWPLTFDFTPADKRPFAGSTQDGSMISLSLGWNGVQRIIRNRGRRPVPAAIPTVAPASGTPNAPLSVTAEDQTGPNGPAGFPQRFQGRGRRGGGQNQNRIVMWINTSVPGVFRLADPGMAGQVLWFLPLCVIGLIVQARKSKKNLPLFTNHQSLLMWGAWVFIYAVVFSFMQAGVHPYYLVMLSAPMAALTGIGVRALWLDFTQNRTSRILPLSLLLAGVWQAYIVSDYPDWEAWLIPCLLIGLAAALIGLSPVADSAKARTEPLAWEKRSLALALGALFLSPFAWALTPVLGNGGSVEANPNLISGDGGGRGFFGGGPNNQSNMNNDKLVRFLEVNHQGEKYLLVAQSSMPVSPLIIKYGAPVIALGGFGGRDTTCTVDQFAQRVKDRQIRYFLLGGDRGNPRQGQPRQGRNANANNVNWGGRGGGGGWGNQGGFQADISKWVRDNGKPVDPNLWRIVDPREANAQSTTLAGNFGGNGGFGRRQGGGQQLYDLRPNN
jgi:4-amino-4-deoxy-L-arabinose transferase-like glycosyltransferase